MVELETKVDDIDKEIGTVKSDVADLGVKVNDFIKASEIVELAIGNDDATKAANIAKLGDTQHTFLLVLIMVMVQLVGFLLMEVMLLS